MQMVLPPDEKHGTGKENGADDEDGQNGHEEHDHMGNDKAQAKIHTVLLSCNALIIPESLVLP